MEHNQTNWTKEEFLAYLLIYCMHADSEEKDVEIKYIQSKVGDEVYTKTHDEFSGDNDYISLSKIQSTYKALDLDINEKHVILQDIEEIFGIDGHLEAIEQGIQMMLNKLLKD